MKRTKGKKKIAKKKATKKRAKREEGGRFERAVLEALIEAGEKNGLCIEHSFKEAIVFITSVIAFNDDMDTVAELVNTGIKIGYDMKEEHLGESHARSH